MTESENQAVEVAPSAMTLAVFGQLLEPEGIVPAQDFAESGRLICEHVPVIELRAKIRFILNEEIQFVVGAADEVRRLMRHWRAELSPQMESTDEDLFVSGFADDEILTDLALEAPIIRLVNHLFARVLDLDASDIHFEPNENHLDIRCRVDGIMTRIERLPIKIHNAVASRLKLMAKLDIGEKRLPQDGRIDYQVGSKQLDMRVSTLPGVHGESVVLRILDRSDTGVSLLKACEAGIESHLVVITDGALGGDTSNLVDVRQEEVHQAAEILGLASVDSWQQPDRGLTVSEELVNRICQKVRDVGAASIFFPGPLELHPDHRISSLLVWAALQHLGQSSAPNAYSYEVAVQNPINLLIDITAQMPRKEQAMAVYASQNHENNYEELVLSLDKGRTFTLPAEVNHAEGFYHYSQEELTTSLMKFKLKRRIVQLSNTLVNSLN